MRKAMIIVRAKQDSSEAEPGSESMELLMQGEYRFADGEAVARYTESPVTGMADTITTIRVSRNGAVTLNRSGSVNSTMMFEHGKKQTVIYSTRWGETALGVSTITARSELDKHGGTLELDYVLDHNNVRFGRNSFTIEIKPYS